jgi:hypothetical protein
VAVKHKGKHVYWVRLKAGAIKMLHRVILNVAEIEKLQLNRIARTRNAVRIRLYLFAKTGLLFVEK